MTKYRIIEGCSADDLQFKVQQHIDEGWRPQGGVAIICFNYVRTYAQAMVMQQ